MTETQKQMFEVKMKQFEEAAEKISRSLQDEEWVTRFTRMAFYRNWADIDSKLPKIINIAEVNSPAVAVIVEQKHTKIGLSTIEKIATVVTDESQRAKIREYLLMRSWENAKRDVDLIIAEYETRKAS